MWLFKKKKVFPKLSLLTAADAKSKTKQAFDFQIEKHQTSIISEIKDRCYSAVNKFQYGMGSAHFEESALILSNWLMDQGYEVTINSSSFYIEIKW